MSRSVNMLRTRRRDNNVKPNRRLDRKSSRGMIYENEELRLRTININAEIERGQYDIKKLKRENEMLKKEIWCLRDEYEKLDKLLKEKEYDFSSSSTTCSSDSESCSSCTEESEEVETSQNLENVQKTNMKNLHSDFDHLSVVPEENSTENSDRTSIPNDQWNCESNVIKPDQSYPPTYQKASTLPVAPPPKNFFSPIKMSKSCDDQFYTSEKVVATNATNFYQNMVLVPKPEEVPTMAKTSTDLIVKTDNRAFNNNSSRSTFSNGGNLEELLNDIETISQDILKITNDQNNIENAQQQAQKPYKSELSVVLMPSPMPLLGFDKYRNIENSFESLHSKSAERLPNPDEGRTPAIITPVTSPPNCEHNPFIFGPISDNSDFFNSRYNPENFDKNHLGGSKTNLLDLTSSDLISSENEENLRFQTSKVETPAPEKAEDEKKTPKLSIRRKVSIHFKGKRDKSLKEKRNSFFDNIRLGSGEPKQPKTPSVESRKSTTDAEPKTPTSSDSKTGSDRKKVDEKKQRKSVSVSPDRKHVHVKDEKKHKKHRKSERMKSRRGTITSVDRLHRERSFSVCTERSNVLDHTLYDDFGAHSERERTNSLSSCETVKTRKMSNISNIPLNGKVPWCACWGNGCI